MKSARESKVSPCLGGRGQASPFANRRPYDLSAVRGSADPLARSQETTSCRIRTGSGATVVDRIPNEFIESSLCDRSVMKPSRVLCVAAVVVAAAAASVPTYLHASRSMNSNPQKKRERKMEGERERSSVGSFTR